MDNERLTNHEITICLRGGAVLGPFKGTWSKDTLSDVRELSKDFEPVIKERGLQTVWANMLENLFQAAELHPWVVVNGAPDSQLLPAEIVETVRLRGQTADEDTSLPCHGPSCATAGVIGLTIKPLVLCANPRATTGQPPHTPAPRTAMVRGAAGKAGGLFTP